MSKTVLRSLMFFWLLSITIVGTSAWTPAGITKPRLSQHVYLPLVSNSALTEPLFSNLVEVPSLRSPYQRVYTGTQGEETVVQIRQFAEPDSYYNPLNDTWNPIDTRLVEVSNDGYRNKAGGFQVTFADAPALVQQDTSPREIMRLRLPGASDVAIALPEGSLSNPIVVNSTITYPNTLNGSDLVYTVYPWGIKEEIILTTPTSATRYELLLDTDGAIVRPGNAGDWFILDDEGNAAWRIPSAVGFDARGAAAPLTFSIIPEQPNYRAILEVDAAWLRSPERVFPIRLDPTIVNPHYYGGETYIQENCATEGCQAYNQRSRALGYFSENRSVNEGGFKKRTRILAPVDLSTIPAVLQSGTLVSANYVLYQYAEYSNTSMNAVVAPVLRAWDENVVWNSRPLDDEIGSPINTVLLDTSSGYKRFDITSWVAQVLAGSVNNFGITIQASNELQDGRFFWSSRCDPEANQCSSLLQRPHFEFTYVLPSGMRPNFDTFAWENSAGRPSVQEYIDIFGLPATTHGVEQVVFSKVIAESDVYTMPFGLASVAITPTLSLTETLGLTVTLGMSETNVMRPISYLYEEILYQPLFTEQFTNYYANTLKGGLCLGMTGAAAHFHATGGPSPADFGGTTTVRSIPKTDTIDSLIQKFQVSQVGAQALTHLAEAGIYDVGEYYDYLFNRINTTAWKDNPEVIGLVQGLNCTDIEIGHAVLPIDLIILPDNKARILVYDPNFPPGVDGNPDRYIDLDLATNQWTFSYDGVVEWSGTTLSSLPLNILRQRPIQPHQEGSSVIATSGGVVSLVKRRGPFPTTLTPTAASYQSLFGRRGSSPLYNGDDVVGCYPLEDSTFSFRARYERIYRFTPLTVGTRNERNFPDTLYFPAQTAVVVGGGGTGGGIGDMLLFGPRAAAGALTLATTNTRDYLDMDAAFRRSVLTTQDAPKPVTLYQLRETDAWTRIFAVSNISLGLNEQLIMESAEDANSFKVTNVANRPKTFDVGFGQVGGDLLAQKVYSGEQIGPGATIEYIPWPWRDLPGGSILVNIDNDSDGVVDEQRVLGGRVKSGLQAVYDFNEGSGTQVRDVSGVGDPLNLTIQNPSETVWTPGGLKITGFSRIASRVGARKLVTTARNSDEITVEAWVTPAEGIQSSARIVTISPNANNRNFSLIQGLVRQNDPSFARLLLRTSTNPSANKEVLSSSGTIGSNLTHIVATFDSDGIARIYVNGTEVAREIIGGNLNNWSTAYPLVLGGELPQGRAWQGTYHLVAFYDRALTTAEVQQNYAAGPEVTP